ncbi:NUDIX hydrolase domain-like protein, partial [Collybia nuda]
ELVSAWRKQGLFSDILSHWSNEPCPAFWPSNSEKELAIKKVAFSIERAALPLFSLPNYGVLLIGATAIGELKLWVPRRSPTKKTFPGLLDVTVGGGIALNQTATSAIIRECTEEASFGEATVRKYISQAGAMHYHNRSPKGWLLPGHYTLFTLPLPSDVRPRLNHDDGEVDSFSLMSVEDVLDELEAGAFKPSSALAYVRFLIQQGKINQHTERYFDAIREALEASPGPAV